ncbi:hypothetical protein NL676_007359 [Syzygium grande]|nr:hypothetical protein NL676_007359 [Syzygium grande]
MAHSSSTLYFLILLTVLIRTYPSHAQHCYSTVGNFTSNSTYAKNRDALLSSAVPGPLPPPVTTAEPTPLPPPPPEGKSNKSTVITIAIAASHRRCYGTSLSHLLFA